MAELVEFNCPHCGQLYRLTAQQLERFAGRTTHCRKCQQPFAFPSAEPEPEPEPEAQGEGAPDALTDTEASFAAPPAPHQPYAAPNQTYVPPQDESLPVQPEPEAEPEPPAVAPPARQPIEYRRPVRERRGSTADFFTFDVPLQPQLIVVLVRILFWAASAYFVFTGIAVLVAATVSRSMLSTGSAFDWLSILAIGLALVRIVVGPICVRIVCELALTIFRIHHLMQENRKP